MEPDAFTEEEITFLPRAEYDRRLKQAVSKCCITCESYEEDREGDNLAGRRDKLSLDGTCEFYTKSERARSKRNPFKRQGRRLSYHRSCL